MAVALADCRAGAMAVALADCRAGAMADRRAGAVPVADWCAAMANARMVRRRVASLGEVGEVSHRFRGFRGSGASLRPRCAPPADARMVRRRPASSLFPCRCASPTEPLAWPRLAMMALRFRRVGVVVGGLRLVVRRVRMCKARCYLKPPIDGGRRLLH